MWQVHAYIIGQLKKEGGSQWFYKEERRRELIHKLDAVYRKVQYQHRETISLGDFPDISKMQTILRNHDFSRFSSPRLKLLTDVTKMLEVDIAKLVAMIPQEQKEQEELGILSLKSNL